MTNLWSDSVELMLLGMGSVFVFLALLVIGMMVMSSLLNRFNHPTNGKMPAANSSEAEVAAVAAIAWSIAQKTSKS